MNLIKFFQLLAIALSLCASNQAFGHGKPNRFTHSDDQGSATYLGNEAVMVSLDDTKIIFDPFFHNNFGVYQLVPESIKSKIFEGISPFDGIDLILISHAHADHFSAKQVLAYLEKQTGVTIVAPAQAIAELKKLSPSQNASSRMHAIEMNLKQQAQRVEIAGISVEAVRIPHAGWPSRAEIENLVYRVSLKQPNSLATQLSEQNITVIHMGDADPKLSHFEPHSLHWQSKRTDVAFPPYWFYGSSEGEVIISTVINATETVAVHVPVNIPVALKHSGKDYFSIPGESRAIDKDNPPIKKQ